MTSPSPAQISQLVQAIQPAVGGPPMPSPPQDPNGLPGAVMPGTPGVPPGGPPMGPPGGSPIAPPGGMGGPSPSGGPPGGLDLGAMLGAGPGQPPPEPKKPPLLLPPNLARELAQNYVTSARGVAQQVADYAGPPDTYQRFSLKDQVEAYYKRDLRQNPYELQQQGLSPVEIRDKVYPLRGILLKMAGPLPQDRVDYAQKMAAERRKIDMLEKGESF